MPQKVGPGEGRVAHIRKLLGIRLRDDSRPRPSAPEFTPRQIAAIKQAVQAGRRLCADSPAFVALDFWLGFHQAGGVQVPGREASAQEQRTVIEHVTRRLAQPDRAPSTRGIRDDVAFTIVREAKRAEQEVEMLGMEALATELVGHRLLLLERHASNPLCQALAHKDHGLGPGVIPPGMVVVLPACCDGARFDPLFESDLPPIDDEF